TATFVANFMDNALKYSLDGAEIGGTAGGRGSQGFFAVRDSGWGIAAEHIPNLSSRLAGLPPDQNVTFPATGPGLFLSRGIARRGAAWPPTGDRRLRHRRSDHRLLIARGARPRHQDRDARLRGKSHLSGDRDPRARPTALPNGVRQADRDHAAPHPRGAPHVDRRGVDEPGRHAWLEEAWTGRGGTRRQGGHPRGGRRVRDRVGRRVDLDLDGQASA